MTPAAIIQQVRAGGVNLALTSTGTIKASGDGAAVNRWLPVIRDNKPGIVAALQEAANDPGVAHRHWWIHFPDREPLEVIFAPEQTHSVVLALYPMAVAAEPIPDVLPEPVISRPVPLPTDDRRTCQQCANLDHQRGRDGFRRCAAARRGELPYIASRDYSPVPDVPKRCEGFAPMPDDPDRRTDRERWPELIPNATPEGNLPP